MCDPRRLRVYKQAASFGNLSPGGVTASEVVGGDVPVSSLHYVRPAEGAFHEGLRRVGVAQPPSKLTDGVRCHPRKKRLSATVGDFERALERVQAHAEIPGDDLVPRKCDRGGAPQGFIADFIGDLHCGAGRLDRTLDLQPVGQSRGDSDLEVAPSPTSVPAFEHGTSRVVVAKGAVDIEVIGVDGIDQTVGYTEPGMNLRSAFLVSESLVELESALEVFNLISEVPDHHEKIG